MRLHPRLHFLEFERLRDVVHTAAAEGLHFPAGLADRAQKNHRDIHQAGVLLQELANLIPVQPRHVDVEQNQIGRLLARRLHGVSPTQKSSNPISFTFQHLLEQQNIGRVIVDHHDGDGARHSKHAKPLQPNRRRGPAALPRPLRSRVWPSSQTVCHNSERNAARSCGAIGPPPEIRSSSSRAPSSFRFDSSICSTQRRRLRSICRYSQRVSRRL